LNAQYAEESYQLKRENCTLKKQIEEKNNPNIGQNITQNHNQNSSDVNAIYEELETLRETVNRLRAVSLFYMTFLQQYYLIYL
jgi:polyhydroxyalkanoate synthesis regulator phasin